MNESQDASEPIHLPYPDDLAALVVYCSDIPEFVSNWERLSGMTLRPRKTGLETMIDQATGYNPDEQLTPAWEQFAADVYDLVWCRLPKDLFVLLRKPNAIH